MGKKVNQTELAEVHGVSDVTLWQWQKDGMPVEELNTRGLSHSYDTAATIEWRVAREVKKVREESPRDRLLIAQERLAQITIQEKEKVLVPTAEIEPMYEDMVMRAREMLLQIPALMPVSDEQRAQLTQHLNEALRELSRYEPSESADQAGGAALGAAGDPAGGRLGGGEAPPQ